MHAKMCFWLFFFLKEIAANEREELRWVSSRRRTSFWAPQTDAKADGGELTEDERKRNEKA